MLLIIQKPVRKKFPLVLFILSYFTFILYFILAYSTYVLNIINLNMINKVGKKDNSIKNRNPNLTFPHQSEIENFILFFFISCLLAFQKYLFEVLEKEIHLGLTYSATCQIYRAIWDFPIFSLDRDILCFAQKDWLNYQKFVTRSVKNKVELTAGSI